MGRPQKGRFADLKRELNDESASLRESLQLLNSAAISSVEKVPWKVVNDAAEQVGKKATVAGVLWTSNPKLEEAREEIQSYFNALHGFLLLCHGTTVGAGPTLLSSIQLVAKQVLETSLTLLETALNLAVRGAEKTERHDALPRLVGCVWEACDNVKKAPSDNRTAVGRSLVQVARSIKDVLREMDEVEQASKDDWEGRTDLNCDKSEKELASFYESHDDNEEHFGSSDEVLKFDANFSDEELKIASSTREMVSATLELVKQLLYVVGDASLLPGSGADEIVIVIFENFLKQVMDIGKEIDDIGASIYPPQEIRRMQERLDVVAMIIDQLHQEVSSFLGSLPDKWISAHASFCAAQGMLKGMLADLSGTIE